MAACCHPAHHCHCVLMSGVASIQARRHGVREGAVDQDIQLLEQLAAASEEAARLNTLLEKLIAERCAWCAVRWQQPLAHQPSSNTVIKSTIA